VPSHRDLIVEQFTRQAVPFSTAPAVHDEEALRLLVETSGAGPDDTVLDVACGPGLVVAAFARVVRHATGIDVTPAMLERARGVAAAAGVANVDWRLGDVTSLPWPDATFSLVVSRFAFHHFPDPGAVLAEMRRVCRPGGRVVIADLTASPDPVKAEAFHRMEILRDPSHARALTRAELEALFAAGGLPVKAERFYGLKVDLDGVMSRSFPKPEDVPMIRRMFEDSLAADGFGLGTRRAGESIRFTYPVVILVAAR
jgi:SAM-dependent methyltransferase